MQPTEQELSSLRADFSAWLSANAPKAEFLMPQSFMEVGEARQLDVLRTWQRKVYEAGFLGMAWPTEYGGRGLHAAYQDVISEEMERQRTPFMMNTIGLNWAGPLMLEFAPHEVKASRIKRILTAEDIWCQGFSEPNHGSDLGAAQTSAVRDGDTYVLNGSKIWTTLGPFADYMILLARTDRTAKSKYAGLSFFLIPMKVDGITVSPIRKLTGEYGFSQVFFSDARVPADCLLGAEGQGWFLAMRTLAYERRAEGGQAGGTSGVYYSKVSDLIELAKNSRIDGLPATQDPIVREQIVSFFMDELAFGLAQSRTAIPGLEQRPGAISLMGKLFVSEQQLNVARLTNALLGEEGALYVSDARAVNGGRWPRNYMNLFSRTIGGGTSQIQRNIIGERVLGLPKD
jgi:alkylation response protein AidB-like acyl-CoA dehydrogenase